MFFHIKNVDTHIRCWWPGTLIHWVNGDQGGKSLEMGYVTKYFYVKTAVRATAVIYKYRKFYSLFSYRFQLFHSDSKRVSCYSTAPLLYFSWKNGPYASNKAPVIVIFNGFAKVHLDEKVFLWMIIILDLKSTNLHYVCPRKLHLLSHFTKTNTSNELFSSNSKAWWI